jgi:hypothetical protein
MLLDIGLFTRRYQKRFFTNYKKVVYWKIFQIFQIYLLAEIKKKISWETKKFQKQLVKQT